MWRFLRKIATQESKCTKIGDNTCNFPVNAILDRITSYGCYFYRQTIALLSFDSKGHHVDNSGNREAHVIQHGGEHGTTMFKITHDLTFKLQLINDNLFHQQRFSLRTRSKDANTATDWRVQLLLILLLAPCGRQPNIKKATILTIQTENVNKNICTKHQIDCEQALIFGKLCPALQEIISAKKLMLGRCAKLWVWGVLLPDFCVVP